MRTHELLIRKVFEVAETNEVNKKTACILQQLPDGIVIINSTKAKYTNPKAAAILGLNGGEDTILPENLLAFILQGVVNEEGQVPEGSMFNFIVEKLREDPNKPYCLQIDTKAQKMACSCMMENIDVTISLLFCNETSEIIKTDQAPDSN